MANGLTWKSYQESLPASPNGVNNSDGNFSNLTDFTKMTAADSDITSAGIVNLYAVKHNPFLYFRNVQNGGNPMLSQHQVVAFDGLSGLWGDLATGNVPNLSFIVPNQCNDQHGRGNSTPYCGFDPNDNGTQTGLNPALIALGDQVVQKIVTGIHNSPAWKQGHNAIITVWDENDYSVAPVINQVVAIVDTNYGVWGTKSNQFYTHFSLLRSLEGGFGLPCLNNACKVNVMQDLFAQASK